MIQSKLVLAAILGGAVLVGCDSKDNTIPPAPTATPPKPQADMTAPPAPAMPSATPATPSTMTPPATPAMTPPPTPAMTPPAMPPAATDAAASTDAQAQAQVTQIMDYIKQNKLDLADQGLTKLEGMKSSLSPAMQSQVDSARKALDAAKSMGGAKMPEMPAMPK